MVQGGSSIGAITIMWQQYGVRLNFLPVITPRGTIRLQVAPEVSSLDYTNAVTISGFTVPGLSVRRVQTEVELESGQSFAIAGLLDKQTTENLSKIPGIGDLPLLGKLFQSKTLNRSNSELLILITPEIVRPVAAGQRVPDLNYPVPFLPDNGLPRTPGIDKTGMNLPTPPIKSVPLEQLIEQQKQTQSAPALDTGPSQGSPAQMNSAPASPNSGTSPAPAGGSGNR